MAAAAAAKPSGRPTITANPHFNVEENAKALAKAMRGLGTDESAIVTALVSCDTTQRVQLKDKYKALYGKDLIADLKSELGGNFEAACLALLQTSAEFDAWSLRQAMSGAGTKEETIVEILCSRSNADIAAIKASYNKQFSRDLEKDVASETGGSFRSILVALLQAARDESGKVDRAKAAAEAKALQAAGAGQWGTDESEFNRIFMGNSNAMIRAISEEYTKLTGTDLLDAVKREMSGSLEDAFVALVKCTRDTPSYFAEKAHEAMSGAGTDDAKLIRVIVSRAERDLADVKDRFAGLFGKPLGTAIKDDCAGDYKRLLLCLVRE